MAAPASRDTEPVVLVVGDVIDDVIVRPLTPVTHGSDTRARITPSPGGSGANQAVWLADAGAAARFVGRVGAADLERHTRVLTAAGVDARLAGDDERPTGTIVIVVDPVDGERTMYTDRGANLGLCRTDLPATLLDGVGLLHLSGYGLFDAEVRRAVRGLMAQARERGIPVAVDPASVAFLADVGVERFLDWVADATLLLPNLDEGRLLTGRDAPEAIVHGLLAHVPEVALTLGRDGALVASRDHPWIRVAAVDVEVVDTTGAGDAFAGTFLAGWVRGRRDRALVEAAVAAAARAVGTPGARPAVA